MELLPLYVGLGVAALSGALAWANRRPRSLLPVLSDAEKEKILGSPSWKPAPRTDEPGAVELDPTWVRDNIVQVELPELAELAAAKGWKDWRSGKVYFHRAAADDLRALFSAWKEAGVLSDMTSFDGSWNPRLVRGSATTLSNHALGAAFDVNAAQNPLGQGGAGPGERGSTHELERIAALHGFANGRGWKRPDPMHFEYARRA